MNSIERKTLLYRSGVEYADYCINHIQGCAHGCRFPCYAMLLKKRAGIIKGYEDWIQPKIVSNALELLERELPNHRKDIRYVFLSFSSDPFMFNHPEVSALTLRLMERLNRDGIRCVTLTKGLYPKELADTQRYSEQNEYGITLVSLSEHFRKRYEPHTAAYRARIESLKLLREHGLKTWVSIEPYPTPNMIQQNLSRILGEMAFVDKIVFGRLNYNPISSRNSFPRVSAFYDGCARAVANFCARHRIRCHIKKGTTGTRTAPRPNVFT